MCIIAAVKFVRNEKLRSKVASIVLIFTMTTEVSKNYLDLNWLLLYHLAQGSSLDLQGDPYKCGIGRWRQDSWYYCKWLPATHETSELRTLELETFNLDCLIRISNADTFNFLLNPLFFGYRKTSFSKLESPSRFCILILNGTQNFKFHGF